MDTGKTLGISGVCSCGRKLAPLPFNKTATTIHRRTCRGCRQVWQVKCVPNEIKGGWAHVLTLSPVLA